MWPWKVWRQIADRLTQIETSLSMLLYAVGLLVRAVNRQRRPRRVRLFVTKEIGSMLKFKLQLPERGAPDVVKRELEVAVGAGEPVFLTLDGAATEASDDRFAGNDNDEVDISLVDIDDAGNRSEPRDQTFVLLDTLAPPQPGQLGLVVTNEE